MNGVNIPTDRLHGPVEFPVSGGTPMIAPYIAWDHGTSWPVPQSTPTQTTGTGALSLVTKLDYNIR